MSNPVETDVVIRVHNAEEETLRDGLREDVGGAGNQNKDARTGRTTPRIGVKLKMPSGHLSSLSRVYNQILALKDTRGVKQAAFEMLIEAESHLQKVKDEWNKANPADEAQQEFKEQWFKQHVEPKEIYLKEVRKALEAGSRSSRNSVRSSKASRALNEARAREAALQLRQKQLAELEEERERIEERRRQEEEQRLQRRQVQLELNCELEEAKLRREALEQELGSDEESVQEEHMEVHRASLFRRVEQAAAPSVANWLRSTPPPPSHPPECQSASIQDHLLQHVLLAQAKLPVFKGDPTDFLWFMKAFEEQVEAVTGDPKRRLYLLLQQLSGEPHTLIKGCQLALDPQEGYRHAKALLTEKYGNPIQMALGFKEKLMSWAQVKNAKDISGYCVQLQLCRQIQIYYGGLEDLNAASTLLKLVSKLPTRMQGSWQTHTVDLEVRQRRAVNFEDLVQFVQRQDRARNHPVFGKLDAGTGEVAKTPKAKVLATETQSMNQLEQVTAAATATIATGEEDKPDAFKAPCLLCKGGHPTNRCNKAEDMPRKDRLEKLRGLCFSCLKPGHSARTCRGRLKCDKCQSLHPTILHEERDKSKASPSVQTANSETVETAVKEKGLLSLNSSSCIIATVPVRLGSGIETRAALDSASTATFITRDLAKRLKRPILTTTLHLTTMSGIVVKSVGTIQGLVVSDLEENTRLTINVAYVLDSLPFDEEVKVTRDIVSQFPHLSAIPLQFIDQPVEMLIGINVPKAVIPVEVVEGSDHEPMATRAALGWSIQGPVESCTSQEKRALTNLARAKDLGRQLEQLHYYDFSEAYNFVDKGPSQQDLEWLQRAEATISRTDSNGKGHYTIALPVTHQIQHLQDNKTQALHRLQILSRKFTQSPRFAEDYRSFMHKMVAENFMEEVPEEHQSYEQHKTINYVLHHGVYHPRKPDKIRVVFNCASRFKSVALNDCLLSGPDLTNSIVGVLLRFRQGVVAFMADVEAMFYQVLVPESQRDMLRLLWWRDGKENSGEVVVYRLRVHLFGATSSPAIANFALRRSAEDANRSGVEVT